jgi:hypothetical protein
MKLAPTCRKDDLIVMNMCGRGDKDIFTVGRCTSSTPSPAVAELKPAGPRRPRHLRHRRRSGLRDRRRHPRGLPAAGADVIELGMPFTDPMADGPAIQAAGLRALKAGQTHEEDAADGRATSASLDSDTPIVLMGYYNPIYIYGVSASATTPRRPASTA